MLQRLESGSQRLVMRSEAINSLRFSPDSTKLAAIAGGKRVRVYDIEKDRLHVAADGQHPRLLVLARQRRNRLRPAEKASFTSDSDLYAVPALGGDEVRLTENKNAINPVWGPTEIVFDRFKRRKDDAPAYNLWALEPLDAGPAAAPHGPHDPAADERPGPARDVGRRQAHARGVHRPGRRGRLHGRDGDGQDPRAVADFETGTVGFDLSADGETILAHTGGPDPGHAHDVVTVPYGSSGGETKVLVEDAAYPDWSR